MTMAPWPSFERNLVAILRGIETREVEATVAVLVEAGIAAIEIPLNSPEPFRSVERAARLAPADVLIGAGTVVHAADVDRVHDTGGRLVVSPNFDPAVVDRADAYGMVCAPGVFTATEAFAALAARASALKFFPAGVLGSSGLAALRAVLPPATLMMAVGGVDETNMAAYARAGIGGFGFGTSLYRPGQSAEETARRARALVAAHDEMGREET